MKSHTARRRALAGATTLVAGAALVLAGCTSGPAEQAQSGPSPSSGAQSSGATSSSAAAGFNQADSMFAAMMIPHHEQAVEMSDVILSKDGVDARVTELAETIKSAQGPEITQLRAWLDAWGVDAEDSQMDHSGHGDGMMGDDDMRDLEGATGADASRLFLEQMITHHEGAVEMARTEVSEGRNPEAVSLAQRIVDDQTAEIQQMRDLLGTP